MVGRVVSDKMTKTAAVAVETFKIHPLYKKTYRRTKKYLADDPIGVKIGDVAEIKKIRPISKRKHWQITKVLGREIEEIVEEELKEKAAKEIEKVMLEPSEAEAIAGRSVKSTMETAKVKSGSSK